MSEAGQSIYQGLADTADPHVGDASFFELRKRDPDSPGQGDLDVFVPRKPASIGHSDEFTAIVTSAIAGGDAEPMRAAAQDPDVQKSLAILFKRLEQNEEGVTLLTTHEKQADVSILTGELFTTSKEMDSDTLDHRFTSIYSKLLAYMGLKAEFMPIIQEMAQKHGGDISSGSVLDVMSNYSNTYLTIPDSETVQNAGLDATVVGLHQRRLLRFLINDLRLGIPQPDRTKLHTLNTMCASATTDKMGILSDGEPGLRINRAKKASRSTALMGGRLIMPAVVHNPGDGTGTLRIGKPVVPPKRHRNEAVHEVMDLIAHVKEELSGVPTEYDRYPRKGRTNRVADLRSATKL